MPDNTYNVQCCLISIIKSSKQLLKGNNKIGISNIGISEEELKEILYTGNLFPGLIINFLCLDFHQKNTSNKNTIFNLFSRNLLHDHTKRTP